MLDMNAHKILNIYEDDSTMLQLTKPLDVRWISHFSAINRLIINYSPVI